MVRTRSASRQVKTPDEEIPPPEPQIVTFAVPHPPAPGASVVNVAASSRVCRSGEEDEDEFHELLQYQRENVEDVGELNLSNLEVEDEANATASGFNTSSDSIFQTPSTRLYMSTPSRKMGARSRGPLVKCVRCRRPYRTAKGLQKHMKMHVWQDASAKIPDTTGIKAHCHSIVESVLSGMVKRLSVGMWEEFDAFVEKLKVALPSTQWACFEAEVCNIIQTCLKGKRVTYSSALRYEMQTGVNKALADADARNGLMEKLLAVEVTPVSVVWSFLHEFITGMADKVIIFIAMNMRNSTQTASFQDLRSNRSLNSFETLYDKQIVYHIAGACVRGFIRKGYLMKSSNQWKHILACIQGCFLEIDGGAVIPVNNDIKAWTAAISRGKYLFIGLHAFQFFLLVAKLISSCELPDGSLSHSHVQSVCMANGDVLQMWDAVVGTSLSEQESVSFMINIIQSFTNVIGSGIIKKRMNERLRTGNIAVPLRKSIAR